MTPNTPNANQLAESKSISQLRHWRALRKWLSQLYMSTGSGLVPTYLAFQDKLNPYDLICLPNNCNNYTALVKPVHPFLVMADCSWDCSADRVEEGRDIYCRKWWRSQARCYVSNLRQIWWILDRHFVGKTPLQKSKRPGNTRSYSRHLSVCVCVCVLQGLAVWLWYRSHFWEQLWTIISFAGVTFFPLCFCRRYVFISTYTQWKKIEGCWETGKKHPSWYISQLYFSKVWPKQHLNISDS